MLMVYGDRDPEENIGRGGAWRTKKTWRRKERISISRYLKNQHNHIDAHARSVALDGNIPVCDMLFSPMDY